MMTRRLLPPGLLCAVLTACAGTQVNTQTPAAGPPGDRLTAVPPPVAEPAARIRDIRPGERPAPDSDEAALWMLMDRIEAELRTAPNLIRDPALNRYVGHIVCRLAGPYCGDIRPYIIRRAAFNATMGPNGVLVIWSGALARFGNEAQLAAVLGHEIAHYQRRHSLQRLRDISGKAGFLNALSIGTIMAGVPLAGDVAHFAVLGAVFSFSRENEREADEIGVRLMAEAGYDPREAAAVWRQLIAEQKADKDASRPMAFFATHPPATERMETLARRGAALAASTEARRRAANTYRRIRAPYLPGWLRDEFHRRRFARIAVLLDGLAAAGVPPALIHFYRGEMLRLQGGNDAKAVAAYRRAIGAGAVPPELHRALGLVHRRLGEPAKAREAFAAYLRRADAAPDRSVIRALMASGQ